MNIQEYNLRLDMYKTLPKNSIGAEIGVCKGKNALNMYNIIEPKLMYLVDIWEKNELTYLYHPPELYYDDWSELVGELFKDKNVKLCKQNGFDFLGELPDQHLDWIYLDSDHNYETVHKEIELSIKKVKKGGHILGHDFIVHNEAWKAGVIRAVIEHIQAGHIKMTGITIQRFASYKCEVL